MSRSAPGTKHRTRATSRVAFREACRRTRSLCFARLNGGYFAQRQLLFCQVAAAREFEDSALAVVHQQAAGAVWARAAAARRRRGRASSEAAGCFASAASVFTPRGAAGRSATSVAVASHGISRRL